MARLKSGINVAEKELQLLGLAVEVKRGEKPVSELAEMIYKDRAYVPIVLKHPEILALGTRDETLAALGVTKDPDGRTIAQNVVMISAKAALKIANNYPELLERSDKNGGSVVYEAVYWHEVAKLIIKKHPELLDFAPTGMHDVGRRIMALHPDLVNDVKKAMFLYDLRH